MTTRGSPPTAGRRPGEALGHVRSLKLLTVLKFLVHTLLPLPPSGPDGVKIENADSAIATVTGLEVGTYTFTLTVTDERNLENSNTVTVIVREGEQKCVVEVRRHLGFLTFSKMC